MMTYQSVKRLIGVFAVLLPTRCLVIGEWMARSPSPSDSYTSRGPGFFDWLLLCVFFAAFIPGCVILSEPIRWCWRITLLAGLAGLLLLQWVLVFYTVFKGVH